MKKKYIIFDLDGTLLDTKNDLLFSINHIFSKYHVKEITVDELLKNLGLGLKYLFDNSLKEEIEESTKESMFKEFLDYYSSHLTVYTVPYKNVVETLNAIKEKGIKMAVVSNKKDEYARLMIDYYFPLTFDYVTGMKEGYNKKPSSDLVYLALDKLNATVEETVYVGDSIYDIETARNSKLDSIILSYGYSDINKLKEKNPEVLIDDFKDILNYI